MKLKKVIPIFMFIFSMFLIGNSKTYALTSKTLNYDDVYLNDYFNKLSEKNEYDYNSLNQYYKQAIDFVNSGEYLQYGKYYAIVFTSNETAELYMSDDEQMFKFNYWANNYFWFDFVSTNSKLYLNSYSWSGNSKYEFAVNQSYGSFLSSINLEKNTFPKYNPIIITNLNKIYQSSDFSNTTNQTTYNPGDVVFNIDNGNISLNSNFVKKEPEAKIDFVESKYNDDVFLYNKYRLNIENFNENYIYYFAKYSEKDVDMTTYNKYSEFYYEKKYYRVLYGKENQSHLNSEKTYFDFILNKNDIIIVDIRDKDDNYITGITYTVSSIEENDNILPYITTDEASICKVKYKDKEYITCKTYTINAHFPDLTSYYLYLSTDYGKTFNKVDTNYGVYTFSGKTNNESFIFKVLDKDGNYITSATYTIVGLSDYEDVKSFVYITVDETLSYDDELDYHYASVYYWIYNWDSSYKLYYRQNNCPKNDDKYRIYPLSHSDSLYGIGYKYTNDLFACFVVYDKDDNYLYSMTHSFSMDSVYKDNTSAFYQFLDKWWTNITAPFTVFKQFVQIVNSLDYTPTSTMTPSFTIDFSYFNVDKPQAIVNFSWYLEYRDIIFNFIYLTFGTLTCVKVIHNLRHVFGGGS